MLDMLSSSRAMLQLRLLLLEWGREWWLLLGVGLSGWLVSILVVLLLLLLHRRGERQVCSGTV